MVIYVRGAVETYQLSQKPVQPNELDILYGGGDSDGELRVSDSY